MNFVVSKKQIGFGEVIASQGIAFRKVATLMGGKTWVFLAGLALPMTSQAHMLKEVLIVSGRTETYLQATFESATGETEFPLYFQKSDQATGTLTLSFLETESAFPLGKHAIDSGGPGFEDIQIRKMTSPSGKTFLGLELRLKELPTSEILVQSVPKGKLKVVFGSGTKQKFKWSLTKALKAREDYLKAQAAPPPAQNTPMKVEGKTIPVESTPASIEASTPEPTPALSTPIPMAPKAPEIEKKNTQNVGAMPPDPVKSAHTEGAALEKSHAKKGLSSSKVFSLGNGNKEMIMLKDSVEMKDQAGPDGKPIKKVLLGSKVIRLEGKAGQMRIVDGDDTGYVRSTSAVYSDEITATQEKSLKSMLETKQAKLAAWEAKVAAQEAKLAAKAEAARLLAEKKAAAAQKKIEDKQLAEAAAVAKAQQAAEAKAKATAPVTAENPAPTPVPEPENPANAQNSPKLAIANNPELADKLAREKKAAEDEKMRIEPEENRVTYNSFGRRDPFIPVDQGSIDNGIDIDQMKVVGIIWQSSEPMAVLEHTHEANVSFTVKQGDPVHNGRVARITRESVTFDISEYGISRSYSLKLVSSKEGTKP